MTKFCDRGKNISLIKNPQYLPDFYETLSKRLSHEQNKMTKFQYCRAETVDFLLLPSPKFLSSVSRSFGRQNLSQHSVNSDLNSDAGVKIKRTVTVCLAVKF